MLFDDFSGLSDEEFFGEFDPTRVEFPLPYPPEFGEDDLESVTGDGEVIPIDSRHPWPTIDVGEIPPGPGDKETDRQVFKGGFEVLAFYKSWRFLNELPFRGRWGIFYRLETLPYMNRRLGPGNWNIPAEELVGFLFLRAHESYHFDLDRLAFLLESSTGQHLYRRLRWYYRGRGSHCVEEALANKRAYNWATKNGVRKTAARFMKRQPNAYARFDEDPTVLRAELMKWFLHPCSMGLTAFPELNDWWGAPTLKPRPNGPCPEYFY